MKKDDSYYEQIVLASNYVKAQTTLEVRDAVVLGTGLGAFEKTIAIEKEIRYQDIPNFPLSTVESHKGKLILGRLNGKPILLMSGRIHYYEGYTMKEVTFPIRVMQFLGIQNLYITNVAGGTNENFKAGDLVVIKDHINFMPENPLRGYNDLRLGPRFPDMKESYSSALRKKAFSLARKHNLELKEGVYFSLQGPNLETPAEYQFIHNAGADLVGMSTVPEVIVAKHADLNIFAVSIVSNVCYPIDQIQETTLESVIEVAENAGAKLSILLRELI